MPFPPLDESGLLLGCRRSAAVRAAGLAARLNLVAFLKTFTDIPLAGSFAEIFEVIGDSAEERKAHADRIAERLGAETGWRNGYYMATMTVSELPAEIHFNPPIFASYLAGEDPGKAA